MDFPELQNEQFAVIHAEKATGIVLDAEGKRIFGSSIKWVVFDSLDEANNYCNLKITDFPTVECNIYNHLQKWVKTVS